MNDCIFCKIVKKEAPATFIHEDDQVVAFYDNYPSAPKHALIVPKKHIESLENTTEKDNELLGHIQVVARKIARELGIENGYKVITNNGPNAGQVVFHLHYHVMGGWKNKQK